MPGSGFASRVVTTEPQKNRGRAADSRPLCQNMALPRKFVVIASAAQPGEAGHHHQAPW